ncbi:MAG: hypothetical protein UY48_C0003G0097 [Candidatus Gottesmanbacteria bacterium GW2011_GWB1_49_7]|uniref:Spore protein YkvP/CgeB glycosyl transferase-like domain-containing protein n=1 Tax=Candidatus Gottesmanbacteria bacterium GW2011_GWB1_49_7 TaxID=1618448 RepID=A0A0G1W3X8_9BACT|nr:MAG: hypothetical protein UY48_C0003G0097 [Candidatus Gottesmanbacteria bacterium GW2011_GWB1_49_7]
MPRILFLTHPEGDYGGDLLYRGLVNVLGADNVIEWPYKPAHHEQKTYETVKGSHPVLPDHEGFMAPHSFFDIVTDAPIWTLDDLAEMSFDAVITESSRKGIWAAFAALVARGVQLKNIGITDSEDAAHFPSLGKSLRGMDVRRVFIKEAHSYKQWGTIPILPLPFSCGWGDLCAPGDPTDPNRSGAYFQCSPTHPKRGIVVEALAKIPECSIAGTHGGSPKQYCDNLQRALLGISVRGFGMDTLRNWEIPFFGAVLVTDTTIKVPYDDFVSGEDCFRWQTVEQLVALVKNLLAKPKQELLQVAKAGQVKLLRSHTHTKRARYVLKEMGVI